MTALWTHIGATCEQLIISVPKGLPFGQLLFKIYVKIIAKSFKITDLQKSVLIADTLVLITLTLFGGSSTELIISATLAMSMAYARFMANSITLNVAKTELNHFKVKFYSNLIINTGEEEIQNSSNDKF